MCTLSLFFYPPPPSWADVCQFAEALQKDFQESEPPGDSDPSAAGKGQAGEGTDGRVEAEDGGGGKMGEELEGKGEEKEKDTTAPEERREGD